VACWIAALIRQTKDALDLQEKSGSFGIASLGYPQPGFVKRVKNRKDLRMLCDTLD